MVQNNIVLFLLEWLVSVVGCYFFLLAGWLLLRFAGKGTDSLFYPFFHGINFCVALYAVIQSHFMTIHSLVVGFYAIWLGREWIKRRGRPERGVPGSLLGHWKWMLGHWKWIFWGCLFFMAVFNFFPEGQFKQYDIFFYTKIAESMNGTGQENLHGYNNFFAAVFHGPEPYHYAEIWLNAMLMRCTSAFLPDVRVFRFVGYTILSVCVFLGLREFYAAFSGRRVGRLTGLFCVSFFFFLPDVVAYSPFLQHYLVYNFENNFFERPNFRVVYLYLLPFLLDLKRDRADAESAVYFVSMAVVSYLNFLVLVPATLLFAFIGCWWPGRRREAIRRGVLAVAVGLLFYAFYYLFANRLVGKVYEDSIAELVGYVRQSGFFVWSTIVTTLGYMVLVVLIYCSYFLLRRRGAVCFFIKENGWLMAAAGSIVLVSVVLARVLSYQNNAYQVAYLGYMLISLFVFAVWAYFGGIIQSRLYPVIGLVVFMAGYIVFKVAEGSNGLVNVYDQNGTVLYGGKPYSAAYLAQVRAYVTGRKRMIGGYLADSAYYRDLYFSSRNPTIYSLPISYVIAGQVGANYEFCLADSAVLFAGMDGKEAAQQRYLGEAVRRSGFYVYQQQGRWKRREALFRFIKERRLGYLILSGENCEGELAGLPISRRFEDRSTGEIFLVIE